MCDIICMTAISSVWPCDNVCIDVWHHLYGSAIPSVWPCDNVCIDVWYHLYGSAIPSVWPCDNVCIDAWYHLYGSATLLGCATVCGTLHNSPKHNEAKSVFAEWTNTGSSLTLETRQKNTTPKTRIAHSTSFLLGMWGNNIYKVHVNSTTGFGSVVLCEPWTCDVRLSSANGFADFIQD